MYTVYQNNFQIQTSSKSSKNTTLFFLQRHGYLENPNTTSKYRDMKVNIYLGTNHRMLGKAALVVVIQCIIVNLLPKK